MRMAADHRHESLPNTSDRACSRDSRESVDSRASRESIDDVATLLRADKSVRPGRSSRSTCARTVRTLGVALVVGGIFICGGSTLTQVATAGEASCGTAGEATEAHSLAVAGGQAARAHG